jgi:hypothetical protein
MNADQIKKFRSRLIRACNKHLKEGGKIVAVTFRHNEKSCPIGALTGPIDESKTRYSDALSQELGFVVTKGEFWDFIAGFDGSGHHRAPSIVFDLGKELRFKYLGRLD